MYNPSGVCKTEVGNKRVVAETIPPGLFVVKLVAPITAEAAAFLGGKALVLSNLNTLCKDCLTR